MPVKIKPVKGGYSVSTPGGVKAKKTSKKKAKAQANLLQGVEHGWKPTGKKEKRAPVPKPKKLGIGVTINGGGKY